MDPYGLTLFVYNLTLVPMIFTSILFLLIVLLNFVAKQKQPVKGDIGTPFVTVQIPTFNDPWLFRCAEHCLNFDYPKDRYEVMIVCDSSDAAYRSRIDKLAADNPGRVVLVRRDNREGFKPGALNNSLRYARGEFLVVFDSDWMPRPDFLRTILPPFADPSIAIVQSRQGFYNHKTNLITRFASHLLTIYHTLVMPINQRINCVFFCGTAGAIRRSAFEAVGGWNKGSITEDSDLSVRLLMKGYKTAYLDYETPSEVPDTFESFLKQQMRWGYGNARVFFDYWRQILYGKGLTIKQRVMISWITLSNGTAFIVIIMTLVGISGWFLGDPKLLQLSDLTNFLKNFFVTGGFLLSGLITFVKRRQVGEIPYFIISAMTIGLLLSGTMCIAFTKAALNKPLFWHRTRRIIEHA